MQLLITGANGFVGRALCAEAVARGFSVLGITRAKCALPLGVQNIVIDGMTENTDWQSSLPGCDTVVHLAARVHVMQEVATDPLAAFRQLNVDATVNLARQAAEAGVRRFVFVSSIKVNGESTLPGKAFTADDKAAPLCDYGLSKMEAEMALRQVAAETGMELVIIRPPLVYGPIKNSRSFVAMDNLVDLILLCCTHPVAVNQTFLVSDDEDVSTSELLRRMAQAMACPAHLIPVPGNWLASGAALLGKREVAQRLLGSLQVDIAKTKGLLNWRPVLTLDQGLRRVVEGERDEKVI